MYQFLQRSINAVAAALLFVAALPAHADDVLVFAAASVKLPRSTRS